MAHERDDNSRDALQLMSKSRNFHRSFSICQSMPWVLSYR